MNKILPAVILSMTFAGCRTPLTPETSWADYSRYYSPTGATASAPEGPATIRTVSSKEMDAAIESLKSQGYVVLGIFKIADGTDISRNAVAALSQKLGASEVVWSSVQELSVHRALPNPDLGIVGVDKIQMAQMNADRPDQTFAEQVLEAHHVIWMLGKKGK